MRLQINGSRTIKTIQKEFSNRFPHLNIEFFSKTHRSGEGSKKKFMENDSKTLDECRSIHQNGVIEVLPSMTVADLENNFLNNFGLSVQIFRQSGKVWLETINTDHWTLAQQNELGESSTTELATIKNDDAQKN